MVDWEKELNFEMKLTPDILLPIVQKVLSEIGYESIRKEDSIDVKSDKDVVMTVFCGRVLHEIRNSNDKEEKLHILNNWIDMAIESIEASKDQSSKYTPTLENVLILLKPKSMLNLKESSADYSEKVEKLSEQYHFLDDQMLLCSGLDLEKAVIMVPYSAGSHLGDNWKTRARFNLQRLIGKNIKIGRFPVRTGELVTAWETHHSGLYASVPMRPSHLKDILKKTKSTERRIRFVFCDGYETGFAFCHGEDRALEAILDGFGVHRVHARIYRLSPDGLIEPAEKTMTIN